MNHSNSSLLHRCQHHWTIHWTLQELTSVVDIVSELASRNITDKNTTFYRKNTSSSSWFNLIVTAKNWFTREITNTELRCLEFPPLHQTVYLEPGNFTGRSQTAAVLARKFSGRGREGVNKSSENIDECTKFDRNRVSSLLASARNAGKRVRTHARTHTRMHTLVYSQIYTWRHLSSSVIYFCNLPYFCNLQEGCRHRRNFLPRQSVDDIRNSRKVRSET